MIGKKSNNFGGTRGIIENSNATDEGLINRFNSRGIFRDHLEN